MLVWLTMALSRVSSPFQGGSGQSISTGYIIVKLLRRRRLVGAVPEHGLEHGRFDVGLAVQSGSARTAAVHGLHGAALSHLANLTTVHQGRLESVTNAAVACWTVAVLWLGRVTVRVDRVLVIRRYSSVHIKMVSFPSEKPIAMRSTPFLRMAD